MASFFKFPGVTPVSEIETKAGEALPSFFSRTYAVHLTPLRKLAGTPAGLAIERAKGPICLSVNVAGVWI